VVFQPPTNLWKRRGSMFVLNRTSTQSPPCRSWAVPGIVIQIYFRLMVSGNNIFYFLIIVAEATGSSGNSNYTASTFTASIVDLRLESRNALLSCFYANQITIIRARCCIRLRPRSRKALGYKDVCWGSSYLISYPQPHPELHEHPKCRYGKRDIRTLSSLRSTIKMKIRNLKRDLMKNLTISS
jgi:hypothetical protein